MAPTPQDNKDAWQSNPYVLAVVRTLIFVGIILLVKSLYDIVKWSCHRRTTYSSSSEIALHLVVCLD